MQHNALLNFILPPQCLQCRNEIADPHQLCATCWQNLNFISNPMCHLCGRPFPFQTADGLACASCLRQAPLFTTIRSAFCYDEGIKSLILRYKHGDATDLTPAFARWLYETGQKHHIFEGITAIIPVPLHWRRLFWRQYNQAGLMAQALSRIVGLPYHPEWLRRPIATPPQGRFNKQQRQDNVRGCFQIPTAKRLALKKQTILLIDDVITTGATLTECARVLLRHGAKEVRVLTLARVVTSER